jgi:hypothetical protein
MKNETCRQRQYRRPSKRRICWRCRKAIHPENQ